MAREGIGWWINAAKRPYLKPELGPAVHSMLLDGIYLWLLVWGGCLIAGQDSECLVDKLCEGYRLGFGVWVAG